MRDNKNFQQFFRYITGLYGDNPALHWRSEKEKGKYESLSGNEIKEMVFLAAKSLERHNLQPGDKAAIISETRFEWVIADFACIFNSLVTVPIYGTMTSTQIKYILEHSEAKLCFVSSKIICDKVCAVLNELPNLKKIISFNKCEPNENIINFEDLINSNTNEYNEAEADEYFANIKNSSNADDLFTIIYTSGTTGDPKGVCLTHKNILANIKQCDNSFKVITNEDKFLSFLPLAHTYERTAGYYYPLSVGAKIYYAQSIDTLQIQMQEVKPTIILCVPLMLSRMYTRFNKGIEALTGFKKFITKNALKAGMKYRRKKNHFLWRLANKRVFTKLRDRTGGQIRYFISGGSALNIETADFFDSIGLNVLQGYGMTEASPVISVNRPDMNKIGTVGPSLEGVQIKIAEDGEIIVKGDNVMPGYYKNENDTSETIIDGWLHTGDIGLINEGDFLKITDRKKTLIKTSGGKYISLTHIEDTVNKSPYISQVIAFASDERQFVTALIVPDFDELKKYTYSQNISYVDNDNLVKNEKILELVENEINKYQKELAKYERIRKFALLPSPFTIESGELTPTLKLKRKVIESKYKNLIDRFYL